MRLHYGYYALGYYLSLTGTTLAVSVGLLTWGVLTDLAAVRVGGGVLFGYGVIAAVGSWVGAYVLPENRVRRAERIALSLEDPKVRRILDVRSGRGLLAIAFAKRFPQSLVVAADIWQPQARKRLNRYDPTVPVPRHTPERTLQNAHIEGVAERITLLTSDATQLSLAIEMAKRFAELRVVCVDVWHKRNRKSISRYDPTSSSLRHAWERVRENALLEGVPKQLSPLTANATCLPFADETVDVVTCAYLPLHLHRGLFRRDDELRKRCLQEIFRVLKPGGRVIIAEVLTPHAVNALAWTPLGYVAARTLSKPLTACYWENCILSTGFVLEHSEQRRGHEVWIAFKSEVFKSSHAGLSDLPSGGGAGLSA